jgi:hypothetical protein
MDGWIAFVVVVRSRRGIVDKVIALQGDGDDDDDDDVVVVGVLYRTYIIELLVW